MNKEHPKLHRELARTLRNNMTTAERQLWQALRKRQLNGYRFRRQVVLGRYITDFVCLEARLVIELDGNHHHEQHDYDRERDNWMQQQQFQVLRFWNHEVLHHQYSVLQQIHRALQRQHS